MSTREPLLKNANLEPRSDASLPVVGVRARSSEAIRILIAHDQVLFRDSLRSFLQQRAGIKVVGEAGSADDLVKIAIRLHPDLVLLDLSFSKDGMKALEELQKAASGIRVIMLSGEISVPEILRAMRYGASGFVSKTSPSSVLLKAIRAVKDGQYWLEQENIAALVEAASQGSVNHSSVPNQYGLTPREGEIVLAVLDGLSNPDIAEKFGLSEQTVKHHLSHIFDKLGVYSRLELALFAVSHGLLLDGSEPKRGALQSQKAKSC